MKHYRVQFEGRLKGDKHTHPEQNTLVVAHGKNQRHALKAIEEMYDVHEYVTVNEFSRMPNAKFWEWINNGWVKLKMRPGDELRWGKSWDNGEGWSYMSSMWEYCGDRIYEDWCNGGTDCDGPSKTVGKNMVLVNETQSVPASPDLVFRSDIYGPGVSWNRPIGIQPHTNFHDGKLIMRPAWRKYVRDRVYDVYAEAMNY